jgi:hypothetical protein
LVVDVEGVVLDVEGGRPQITRPRRCDR